jgi:hypothetical protein
MRRWHVDLHHVAELRGARGHVRILPVRLSRPANAGDGHPLEEACNPIAAGR